MATAAAVDSAPDTEDTEELFGAAGFAEMSFEGDEMDIIILLVFVGLWSNMKVMGTALGT